ncbi:choice-of-anchor A family protein [Saccharophagus sp. K07]|jgi:choice-of-anchor A domain-containing protein|uniref:choice-of-anchor A family protein n=1 Tax=Saccharophagus sp. K07 TaxID=2283636 RepID=UPI00165254BA|nr:choice-of-anchor A family protein [Saccharophagus sp. K07]MBC6906019.1 choice-of-anchor A family protein [Saccharophagus sp. K07]
MKRLIARALFAASTSLLSLGAFALPLSEYNLIVAEDYTHQSSSVGGKIFVGGNVIAKNSLDLGLDLTKSPTLDSLTVVGNITGNNSWFNVQAGNVVTGGNVSGTGFNFNGGGKLLKGNQSDLQNQRDNIISELYDTSERYSNLTANGSVVASPNVVSLNYSGSDSVAVFSVNAADVFRQNARLELNAGSAETVIINVSTAHLVGGAGQLAYDFTAPGGINFTSGFAANADAFNLGASNILWNFYDATYLNLQGLDTFRGSLLAIGADLVNLGTADGSIAVKSLIQNRQIHNYTFVPPSEVPLPAPLQFMLIGMACLFGLQQWRKRKQATTEEINAVPALA